MKFVKTYMFFQQVVSYLKFIGDLKARFSRLFNFDNGNILKIKILALFSLIIQLLSQTKRNCSGALSVSRRSKSTHSFSILLMSHNLLGFLWGKQRASVMPKIKVPMDTFGNIKCFPEMNLVVTLTSEFFLTTRA